MLDNTIKNKEIEAALENSQAINEVLTDVCKSQRDTIKRMNRIMCIIIVSLSLIICTMIYCFFKYESQNRFIPSDSKISSVIY